jgi:hypothetical protein
MSRGAKRCLRFLESLARKSGRAFPLQTTIAAECDCKLRMVRYYLAELRRAGFIVATKKRQHSSAEYVLRPAIQTGNNCQSDCLSDCRSDGSILTDLKPSTAIYKASVENERQNLQTLEAWAVSQGMPIETDSDVFRARLAWNALRKPPGSAGSVRAARVAR